MNINNTPLSSVQMTKAKKFASEVTEILTYLDDRSDLSEIRYALIIIRDEFLRSDLTVGDLDAIRLKLYETADELTKYIIQ
jgi:hypothetical protein